MIAILITAGLVAPVAFLLGNGYGRRYCQRNRHPELHGRWWKQGYEDGKKLPAPFSGSFPGGAA